MTGKLKFYVSLFLISILVGMTGLTITEDASLSDAVYFTIVTMSTVGYGDITPKTPAGKVIAVFLILTGVVTFVGVISSVVDLFFNRKSEELRHKKLHVLIGIFFSEMGNALTHIISRADPEKEQLQAMFAEKKIWNSDMLATLNAYLATRQYALNREQMDLPALKTFLCQKKDVLLRLLEHPVLIDEEAFTELLRAIFHVYEEFYYRLDIKHLSEHDAHHIMHDIQRVYSAIGTQWGDYMIYLHANHPHLLLYSITLNPFCYNLSQHEEES